MSTLRFVGPDVHADTIAVAVAEASGEVRVLGTIPNRPESVRKMIGDGVLTAVEGCAAIHGHSTPPPAGWLAAIHRGSLSGPRDLGSP